MALLGGATAARGDPVITGAKHAHHTGKFAEPDERPAPPDFFGEFEDGVRSAKVPSIAMEKTHFAEQFMARQTKQRAHSRILQRRHAKIAACENWRKPASDACTKLAVRIEE